MKAKGYFLILSAVMVGALVFLSVAIVRQGFSWYFIAAEVLIFLVLAILFFLYRRVVKPLDIIGNGMDLLKEQDYSSRLAYVGQKDADRIVDIFNKLMSQLKDEKLHIREQNHFLDLLIKSSPMGVIITDFDGIITVINPAACSMLGHAEDSILGFKLDEIGTGSEPASFLLSQALSRIETAEPVSVRTEDGNVYKCTKASFMDRGFRHPFYLIEQMTQELLKAEKKAYGQVIRMISHEVNNSMAGVTSSLDTVQTIFEEAAEDTTAGCSLKKEDVSDIHELLSVSSDRCISLSNFITAFANVVKIPEPRMEDTPLNEYIENRLRFLESVCSRNDITVETRLSSESTVVSLDPVLMEQVLVNIVKNAAESIGEKGVIIIETMRDMGKKEVSLIISDNGRGITQETANQIFTPFFSTKATGQGIGLTIIKDILIKHGFKFSLSTGNDGWTRFRINIPIK